MKKNQEFHDNKSENIRGESISSTALIRGQRLLTFSSQMRRLLEGSAYSSKYSMQGGSSLEDKWGIEMWKRGGVG